MSKSVPAPSSSANVPHRAVTSAVSAQRAATSLLIVVVFFYWAALYLYTPTLPTYVQTKTANLALVGVVLSMYGLWQAVIRLPLGIAADWTGRRKPFILLGLALAGLGALLMGTAPDVQGILIGRAITGLAAGTWVPLVVVFSGLFSPAEAVQATSLLTLVGSLGRVLATSVTGYLNDLGGYPLAFLLATGLAGLAAALMLAFPEARRPYRRPSPTAIGILITRRDVLMPSLLGAVVQFAHWGSTFSFLPILAKQLGASDVALSALVSLNIVLYTVGNLVATALVSRLGSRRIVYLSFLTLAIGVAGAALAPALFWLFILQGLIGLAVGVCYPVLMGMSIEQVVDAERTTAMGLHQSVYAIGMFGGPWLSGVMAEAFGLRLMFTIIGLAALLLGWLGTRFLVQPGNPTRDS
jgi:MFS family permease